MQLANDTAQLAYYQIWRYLQMVRYFSHSWYNPRKTARHNFAEWIIDIFRKEHFYQKRNAYWSYSYNGDRRWQLLLMVVLDD